MATEPFGTFTNDVKDDGAISNTSILAGAQDSSADGVSFSVQALADHLHLHGFNLVPEFITGATYNVAPGDEGKLLYCNNTSNATSVVFDYNASIAVGDVFWVFRGPGTMSVTISPASMDVTIIATDDEFNIYDVAKLVPIIVTAKNDGMSTITYVMGRSDLGIITENRREISGTTGTLTAADFGNLIEFSSNDPVTFTVPNLATADYPVNGTTTLLNTGAGGVTITNSGVSLEGNLVITQQFSSLTLTRVSSGLFSITKDDQSIVGVRFFDELTGKTIQRVDHRSLVYYQGSQDDSITIQADATYDIFEGFLTTITNMTAFNLTITPAMGVTLLNPTQSTSYLLTPYTSVRLFKSSADNWEILTAPEPRAHEGSWVTVTGTTQQMEVGVRYIANNDSTQIVFTLPSSMSVGAVTGIRGKGAAGYRINQNASQITRIGEQISSAGTNYYMTTDLGYEHSNVDFRCIVANTEFTAENWNGQFNFEEV